VSTDGGSTFKAGATDYNWAYNVCSDAGANTPIGAVTDTSAVLTGGVTNGNASGINGTVRLTSPSSAAVNKMVIYDLDYIANSGVLVRIAGCGRYTAVTAVNAIRFLFTSGNLATGTIRLYGVRK